MWQIITKPEFLVCLHASFEVCTNRRKLNWNRKDYDEQLRRLSHAREHADLLIDTDPLSIEAVLELVYSHLKIFVESR